MKKTKDTNSLFSEFPPVSIEEWEQVIRRDLKGADYKEKLRWKTGEGVEALPFYRQEDLEQPSRLPINKSENNDWQICQYIYSRDITAARQEASQAMNNGADALQFKFHVLATAGMLGGDLNGTAIQGQQEFNNLFEDIDLTQTGLHFDCGMAAPALLAMLNNFSSARSLHTQKVRGSLLYDPYSYILTRGQLPKSEEAFVEEAYQMTTFCRDNLPGVRCLGIDARTYHNAGATLIQELGYALAVGSEYLTKLTDAGLVVDEVAPHIHFNFAVGSNYFLEIAKLRAVRILWEMVVEAYEPDSPNSALAYIHGHSSAWNKAVFDPYTNMLRSTTEGMSAAISGCDSITLAPFDRPYTQPNEFSQRLARNSQIILKEEAYLDQVIDPAAGSYYIEVLTDKIAGAAWEHFREIEQQGGMLKAIQGNYIQEAIEESREQRDQAIAEGRHVFVGTNKYANAEETVSPAPDSEFSTVSLSTSDSTASIGRDTLMGSLTQALNDGALLGDLVPQLLEVGKHDIRTISPYRGPQAFEELRLATEHHTTTPKVLTLPLGDKRLRKARSAFAVNFFSCAGYTIEDPIGFESVELAVQAVTEYQPDVVVLCSSDEEYKQLVPQFTEHLSSLDKRPILVLAGYPKKEVERYQSAGVDVFIHRGSNVLEVLSGFHQKLGIV